MPPPRRETVEDEVQRQNSTFNAFLGGQNRGPSWLTGTTVTPNQQTRTTTRKPAAIASTIFTLLLGPPPRLARSTESCQPGLTTHAPEPFVIQDVPPASVSPLPPTMRSLATSPQTRHPPVPSSSRPPQTPELPAPIITPTTPLAESIIGAGAKRKDMDGSGQAAQAKRPWTIDGANLPRSRNMTARVGISPNFSPQTTTTGETRGTMARPHQQQCPSPVSQTGQALPVTMNTQHRSTTDQRNASPQRRAPLSHPFPVIEPYSKTICCQQMQNYSRSRQIANLPPLNQYEEHRLALLRFASESQDSAFLFLHQIVSMHFQDPASLPERIRNKPGFNSAVRLLTMVLGFEHIRSPDLIAFLAVMPWPIQHVATERVETHQEGIKYLEHLVVNLEVGWFTLITACRKRNCPPLTSELWEIRVASPVLMEMFFNTALRQIWPDCNELHEQALELHSHNKNQLYWLLTQHRQHLTLTTELKVQSDETWGPRFVALFAEHRSQLQQSHQPQQFVPPTVPLTGATINCQRLQHTLPTQSSFLQAQPPLSNTHLHYVAQGVIHNQSSPVARSPANANQGPARDFLFPSRGAPMPDQTATPTWELSALHQAHLREPMTGDPNCMDTVERSTLLYQFVHAFVVCPSRLNADEYQQHRAFFVSEQEMSQIAGSTDYNDGHRKGRPLSEGNRQYRLRVVKVGDHLQSRDDDVSKDWTLKQTSFPLHAYFKFNGTRLEIRRKLHHTKDLPADLTDYVQLGTNKLEIFLHTKAGDKEMSRYAFAIEVVGTCTHASILQGAESRILPTKDVLSSIETALSGFTADNDDLIVDMASSKITIQIVDPISQRGICDLPARGADCRHRECFDLHTFLQTRPRERPTWPSYCDVWKCPICLGDARPQTLVVDGFLMEVKEKLTSEGQSDVRAIIVKADGSWSAKVDEVQAQGDGDERDSMGPSLEMPPAPSKPAPAVGHEMSDTGGAHADNRSPNINAGLTRAHSAEQSSTAAASRPPVRVIELSSDDDSDDEN